MRIGRWQRLAIAFVCCFGLATATQAKAQIGVSKSDVAWIGVAIGAIGAGIGIGIYFAFHHGHSLTGCAVSAPDGLQMKNKGDQQTYSLIGAVAAIKPGDRVRVSGKPVRKPSGPTPQFLVDNVSKDYGACPATP